MKKYALIGLVAIAFVGLVALKNLRGGDDTQVTLTPQQQQKVAPNSSGSTPQSPTNVPTSTSSSSYKDGSYTGSVTDAFYGPMQVSVVISGGKLTDLTFLQYPNEPGHTTEVSNTALPVLKSEALTAQSAQVDVISGASQTTEAFQQSLQSALAQAK